MQRTVKILFVDDEIRIVKLLKMMFRSKYDVYTAVSGAEALALLKNNPVDIVVSDQRMPGMLGIELLAEVRKTWPNTIRLLLTGYTDLVAIIGAVNEGEVYRFLNKPWNHDELKVVIDECAAFAIAADAVLGVNGTPAMPSPPLASAAKLLSLDGVPAHQLEVMEMFTRDYDVISASTLEEARSIISQQEVGVIIVADSWTGADDMINLMREFKENNPYLTIVLVSSGADSDVIIRLINQAHIYRFAMKPISPNVFRLAVSAAMREHHRLLADPRLRAYNTVGGEPEMAPNIVDSLARFTPVW